MLAVADRSASLIITGTGDVLEPELGIVAIGSGGPYAQAAARALLEHTALSAADIVKQSLDHRGRPLHLHEPEPRDRDRWTRRTMTSHCAAGLRRASIAGAGLVGLSLAPALVACRPSVALVDRAAVTMPESPAGGRRTGTRASTRSARAAPRFCASLGAWQALPRRSHRAGRGDARRRRRRRAAQFLGVRARRARARLDRRGARAARGARPRGARRRASPSTRPCAFEALTWSPDARHAASAPTATTLDRAPRRRRRRRFARACAKPPASPP